MVLIRLCSGETGGFASLRSPFGLPSGQAISAALRFPASLETPSPLCPALGPRADLHARPVAALRHGPRNTYNEGSTINKQFGVQSHGFTTCCLRLKAPFPVANQGSLPVDGHSLPGGIV